MQKCNSQKRNINFCSVKQKKFIFVFEIKRIMWWNSEKHFDHTRNLINDYLL